MRQVTYTITFEVKDGHLDESMRVGWTPVFELVQRYLTEYHLFSLQSSLTEYIQAAFPFVQVVRLGPTTTS